VERVDAWRPVEAEELESGRYRILGPVPDGETREFPPESIVRVEMKTLMACLWLCVWPPSSNAGRTARGS
jgi:hypothetical protein